MATVSAVTASSPLLMRRGIRAARRRLGGDRSPRRDTAEVPGPQPRRVDARACGRVGVVAARSTTPRSIATLGPRRRRLGRRDRRRRPRADDRLPDPRGRTRRPASSTAIAACRRAWWPTTWPPASACCRRSRRCGSSRSSSAARPAWSGDEPLLVASGGADGELSLARLVSQRALLGLLGVPHRRRAVHRAAAHRSQRRGPVQPRRRAGRHRLAGRRRCARHRGHGRLPGNMFVPVDLLKPILAELRARGASRGSTRAVAGPQLRRVRRRSVRVIRVTATAPPRSAGLQPGDRIVRIDGAEVGDLETLYKTLWRDARRARRALTIRRDAESHRSPCMRVDRMKTLRRPQGI